MALCSLSTGSRATLCAVDCGHDHFAGGDQDFFIGQRDVFAELDGFVGGGQADDSDGGGDDDFGVGMGGNAFDAFGAEENFGHRQFFSQAAF